MDKIYRSNENKVTIKTGIWGTVSFREGNCMPGSGNHCSEKPVIRQVRIYEKTQIADVINYSSLSPDFFQGFNTTLIKTTNADDQGFFQFELPEGEYTLVVVENDKLYANSFEGIGTSNIINPISVVSSKVTRKDFLIDYKAAY